MARLATNQVWQLLDDPGVERALDALASDENRRESVVAGDDARTFLAEHGVAVPDGADVMLGPVHTECIFDFCRCVEKGPIKLCA